MTNRQSIVPDYKDERKKERELKRKNNKYALYLESVLSCLKCVFSTSIVLTLFMAVMQFDQGKS